MNKPDALRKFKLGLGEIIAMGVGGMIGCGIFSAMGLAAGITGHAIAIHQSRWTDLVGTIC
jgi:amino acid transporter